MISYDEIQNILCDEKFCKLIPDGLILSEPIWGIKDEMKTVNFFVTSKRNKTYNPLYKFSVRIDTIELVEFSEYVNSRINEYEKQIGLKIEEYEQYKNKFAKIGDMYYGNLEVNSEEICDYVAFLFKLIPETLIPYYNELSTDFFEWIKKTI